MMIEFSPKLIKLILHIDKEGYVAKNTKPFLTTLTYYNYLGMAKDMKLVECNGFNDKNQKHWILSPIGKEVAVHLKAINEIMKKTGVDE